MSSFPFLPGTIGLVDRHSVIYQGTRRCRCSYPTGIIAACNVQIERSRCTETSAGAEHFYLITYISLKSGASAQLTATVKPDNATDRKVTWTSSDSSVANVMGTGVVTVGSKAGTATIKATAGGKSASVTVTITDVPKQSMTVYYKLPSGWKDAKMVYRVYSTPNRTGSVQMTKACDGWMKATIPDSKGARVGVAFTSDDSKWDNNAGKLYQASGSTMAVSGGQVIGDVTPNCAATAKQ